MRFLLDTHILVWLHADRKKLSQEAIEILKNSETFTISGEDLYFLCNRVNINYLAIKPEHAIALKTLAYSSSAPRPHKDPFDRMLICQAKTEGMLFLTHDSLIPYYNEPCTVSV